MIGTKGGILTDERARAPQEDGSVIEGLYAAGNSSASVMGHTYPGPGSTIGPATTFGYIAGRDLVEQAAQRGARGAPLVPDSRPVAEDGSVVQTVGAGVAGCADGVDGSADQGAARAEGRSELSRKRSIAQAPPTLP